VFAADYGTGWPKAAAKITDNLEVLLAFYDYPRRALDPPATTNPIESTFATVLRQRGRPRTPPRPAGPFRRGIQERHAHHPPDSFGLTHADIGI
jgi:hypothetical protein